MDPLKRHSSQRTPKDVALTSFDVADDDQDVDYIAENIREHISTPTVNPPDETISGPNTNPSTYSGLLL
jgi:hypothetical protein